MVKDFIKAFRSSFEGVQSFEDGQSRALWTNDPIVRTSTMQSYIYPKLADTLGKYLVCELPTDAAFFERSAIECAGKNGLAYPTPSKAVLCLEHENNAATSLHEMEQLSKTGAALNVLVTYLHATVDQQIAWANTNFTSILQNSRDQKGDFLVVLPGKEQDNRWMISTKNPWTDSDLWRFFLWNKQSLEFYPQQV
jgi:hypothetical protein